MLRPLLLLLRWRRCREPRYPRQLWPVAGGRPRPELQRNGPPFVHAAAGRVGDDERWERNGIFNHAARRAELLVCEARVRLPDSTLGIKGIEVRRTAGRGAGPGACSIPQTLCAVSRALLQRM
jgi:hypothetical protein